MSVNDDEILYRSHKSIRIGQIERYTVTFRPNQSKLKPLSSLFVKIKNLESIALRAAYLSGPYILYCDVKPLEYDHLKPCFITADQPSFEPNLLPGQSFYSELSCHTIKDKYCWVIDIVSQMLFSPTTTIDFEITIGTSKEVLSSESINEHCILSRKMFSHQSQIFQTNSKFNGSISVLCQDSLDLWNLPIPQETKPCHLVLLTHGLHSNVGADMFYIKEQIDKVSKQKGNNVIVRGFHGNVCKTERGVKFLGSRNAEYVMKLVEQNPNIEKISFVGHSLGGVIQLFTIAYIQRNFPDFFNKVKPMNFITIASPLLGISNENPMYVKVALSSGIVGKTGYDLGLKNLDNTNKPLLLLLPSGPAHKLLARFKNRTIYGNVLNDGIVPLRTSALLYLDYKSLSKLVNRSDYNSIENSNVDENDAKKIPNTKDFVVNTDSNKRNEDQYPYPRFHPLQAMMSYLIPQGRSNSKEQDGKQEGDIQDTYYSIPKSSIVESATSILLPPLPSLKFIVDPSSRSDVIFHDKVYTEKDLPPKRPRKRAKTLLQNMVDPYNKTEELEEQIAREYHRNMHWRKVLVSLKPDAHNNIIVRRRFANAYGWPVIDHMVENHFSETESTIVSPNLCPPSSSESTDLGDNVLSDLLSRHDVENQDILKEDAMAMEENVDDWINSKDNSESIFAVGPTGLISDMNELMENFKHTWGLSNGNVPNPESAQEVIDDTSMGTDDAAFPKQIMGNYY